jgi:hypothetical protein
LVQARVTRVLAPVVFWSHKGTILLGISATIGRLTRHNVELLRVRLEAEHGQVP